MAATAIGASVHQVGRVESIGDGVALVSGLADARLEELLGDIEGLKIRTVGGTIILDGEILLPKDMIRIMRVVAAMKDLTRTIASAQPGTTVKIGLWRDGKDMTVQAKLGDSQPAKEAKEAKADKKAEGKEQASYGVALAPLTPEARQELGLKDDVKGALIASVEVKRKGDVRRAKLYYLRDRSGKSARIREKLSKRGAEDAVLVV